MTAPNSERIRAGMGARSNLAMVAAALQCAIGPGTGSPTVREIGCEVSTGSEKRGDLSEAGYPSSGALDPRFGNVDLCAVAGRLKDITGRCHLEGGCPLVSPGEPILGQLVGGPA